MNIILIFDLDDTLYDERTFVLSGFSAVARYLEEKYGLNAASSFNLMESLLDTEGRGKIFDEVLQRFDILTKTNVKKCISVYRHHRPSLSLFPEAKVVLENYLNNQYLVTDGHKSVQYNKVQSLGIEDNFKKIFLTHRYGIIHAKPSIYCFEKIRSIEKCSWSQMAYIGDNPLKDFANLNPLGVQTIRVKTGQYKDLQLDSPFNAKYTIKDLSYLEQVLCELQ